MFKKLYPIAAENGVDTVFYWDMTYGEIIEAIESNQRKTKLAMQFQANIAYQLGSLIGIAFNDPKKYPTSAKEVFPSLFEEEIEEEPKQQDWQIMKERIEKYNTYLKQKRGETD
ncbi:hypothetical protein [Sporanaerobacter acetigenes]|uniref:Uncharacterized protein n=1 Tax=Sporanaerobacter acetigenes DSM 13106 TaxID=1123281 RepID=A0A1M5TYH7_9FIRM|nr:hypothetical protein [Sporanaerobacter acetigenes]SHH55885.1 hypothetical protein SAMN02745180_00473 [Sporanaerobacter acetigenes DSM 13106]